MITVYPFEELGHHDLGWLNARYHFSFARYHNPDRMGFGNLRVINDDIVQAGTGFDTHPHENMEIITYVRQGAITHRDSTGNEGVTGAGDVQIMSAGSGIRHSEHNESDEDTNLYQIWILPREKDIAPRWDAMSFPKSPANDALPLLVSGYPEHKDTQALYINADAALYGGRLSAGTKISHPIKTQAYILVSEGEITINDTPLKKGDGAEITEMETINIHAQSDAEIVVIDVAA